MASLVSPGVSATVIDESFYIPAAAPTVPLFFLATRANKVQPNPIYSASGTTEHSVVRTVTSIGQSTQLYGIPYFWKDSGGNEYHGDARNEYGLFALNQFLGLGNLAYVVRANVDLSDAAETFVSAGTPIATSATRVAVGNGTISAITASSQFVKPESISVIFTSPTTYKVIGSVSGDIASNVEVHVPPAPWTSTKVNFTITVGATPFSPGDYFEFDLVYAPSSHAGIGTGQVTQIIPDVNAVDETWTIEFVDASNFNVSGSVTMGTFPGTVGTAFDNNFINFKIVAGLTPFVALDSFTITLSTVNLFDPLGANDAAKRVKITEVLGGEIVSNQEVRSEIYEYNLIVCPGYPEVVDSLLGLSADIGDEAFVIADTPLDKTTEQTVAWSHTSERSRSANVAYYYPWGISTNLDGRSVCVAPSGIALRTYAYSDNQAYVWFAPAGVRRGTVQGVNMVGYVSGTLGGPTTFVETNLNKGQRDILYMANLNPIVFFPNNGMIVWGQKTSYNATSALDRVNVVRMVMFIKRQLRVGAFPFVFEPNDKITRDNLKAAADAFLNDIMAKRGLYDFVTLCDSSNNTDYIIDNNQMYLDVALKPVKAAEFIYIPIRVLSTGATMPG
jgi:hypothetical protein